MTVMKFASHHSAIALRALACLLALVLFCGSALAEKVIHSFQADGIDGMAPNGRLLESHGKLYGTTSAGGASGLGAVVELVPPVGGGSWTESVIYSFTGNGDAASPTVGLVRDKNGVLYGTSCVGGANGNGAAYQLVPPTPPSTTWTESVIFSFTLLARGYCPSELSVGPDGQFYGTTQFGGAHPFGTVFKLAKQGDGSWRHGLLYSFAGVNARDGATPMGGVISDDAGNLYGATFGGGKRECLGGGCGTVFELQPPVNPGDPWTETVLSFFNPGLHLYQPAAGLARDNAGNLFGTTIGSSGTVFELSPPGCPGWSVEPERAH
jgi:uncharacterized repeat protein (TIGR03803 family)